MFFFVAMQPTAGDRNVFTLNWTNIIIWTNTVALLKFRKVVWEESVCNYAQCTEFQVFKATCVQNYLAMYILEQAAHWRIYNCKNNELDVTCLFFWFYDSN